MFVVVGGGEGPAVFTQTLSGTHVRTRERGARRAAGRGRCRGLAVGERETQGGGERGPFHQPSVPAPPVSHH